MPVDPDSRRRLADAMEQRRTELGMRWQDVAVKSDVSLKALLNVRTGNADIRPLTQRGIEDGLDWPHGKIQRILSGEDERQAASPQEPAVLAPPVAPAGNTASEDSILAALAGIVDDPAALQEFVAWLIPREELRPIGVTLLQRIIAAKARNRAATGRDIFGQPGDDPDVARAWDASSVPFKKRINVMAAVMQYNIDEAQSLDQTQGPENPIRA